MASKQFRVSGVELDFLEKSAKAGDISITDAAHMALTIGVSHIRMAYEKKLEENKGDCKK
jgi:hypothetical protein